MLDLPVDHVQSPVLGAQFLGRQARQTTLRMPRAASSQAKRHHGARSSDLSSVSSADAGHSSSKNSSSSTLPSQSGSRRSNHNPRAPKTNGQARAQTHHTNGFSFPPRNATDRDAVAGDHAVPNETAAAAASSSWPRSPGQNGFAHAKQPNHHVASGSDALRRDSVGSSSVSSSSAAESFTSQSSIHISDDSHRRIDIAAMENPKIHHDPGQPGALGFALTVVRLCPAWDTIAILVLLMQLSGFLLSMVYMLFTFLTFVPPATSIGFNSLSVATVKEVLQESTFSLSYLTVFLVDSIIIMLWLFLWEPAQNLVLDLAKMVIALTLGGGIGPKRGGWRGIFGSLAVIFYSRITNSTLSMSNIQNLLPAQWMLSPLPPSHSGVPTAFAELSIAGKIGRIILQLLAIHIFSQGLMRYVRDRLIQSQKRESQSHSIPDPEAGKLPLEPPSTDNISTASEVEASSSCGGPLAAGSSQPSQAAVSARKKRKQSTHVRLQQPLWAAIASTKIVMKKEMELTSQKELGKKTSDLRDMSNAPFSKHRCQIWLSDVDTEEAFFATSHFPDDFVDAPPVDPRNPGTSSVIDHTKPFYVRINSAVWPSMQMQAVDEQEGSKDGTRWTGRIQGLPAGSRFTCEFVSTLDGHVIFATSFRTRNATVKDADVVASPTQPPRAQRPESPITTLKSSIKTSEAKLAEDRARLKTIKRDNQAKIKSQKKELERLASSIQSSGNNDAKYRSKIQSNNHLKQQHEDQAAKYDAELKEIRAANKLIEQELSEVQAEHKRAKEKFTKEQSEFKAFKTGLDDSLRSLEAEKNSAENKRNKVATRLSKLQGELDQATDRNVQGHREKERRLKEEKQWESDLARVTQSMQDRIRSQHARNDDLERQIDAWRNTMSSGTYYAPPYGIREDAEPTFESPEQGSGTKLNPAAPHYNPTSALPHWATINPTATGWFSTNNPWSNSGTITARGMGSPPAPVGPIGQKPRGRSSSMLSSVSGLTRFSDDDTVVGGTSTITAASTVAVSPPPGFAQSPSPGFPQPQPPHASESQIRRSNTVGSNRSGSGSGASS